MYKIICKEFCIFIIYGLVCLTFSIQLCIMYCIQVNALEKHVTQLRNIISKTTGESEKKRRTWKSRPLDFTKYNTRHVALKFLYIGWDYKGRCPLCFLTDIVLKYYYNNNEEQYFD